MGLEAGLQREQENYVWNGGGQESKYPGVKMSCVRTNSHSSGGPSAQHLSYMSELSGSGTSP